MKNSVTFEEQTEKIVEALLSNFLVKNLPIACCQISQHVFVPETGKIVYHLDVWKFVQKCVGIS